MRTYLRGSGLAGLAVLAAVTVPFIGFAHAVGDDGTVVEIQNGNWDCHSPQNGTVVIVHNATKNDGTTSYDGVHLGDGCTGTIAALIVEHTQQDGIKIGDGAHDLTIESGLVNCDPKDGIVHQDGIQAMGGLNVTIQNFKVICPTGNNGGVWIEANKQKPGMVPPTNVVCDNCDLLEKNAAMHVGGDSISSGVRNSTLHFTTSPSGPTDGCRRIEPDAVNPIDENNTCVP